MSTFLILSYGVDYTDFYGVSQKRRLYVRHQLCRTAEKPFFVCPPKSSSGIRTIPLSDAAYNAFEEVIAKRPQPKIEMMIDGYSGFLFLDTYGRPKVAMHLENYMRNMRQKYKLLYRGPFPSVTPHVLRHTFCTNMQQAGLDPKSLQYVMGHSDLELTLSLYTHSDYDFVEYSFRKALSG